MNHDEAFRNNAVARYLLDEMNRAEMEAYEAHCFVCPVCAQELIVFSELLAELRAAFASAASPTEQLRRCRSLNTLRWRHGW